MKRYINLFVILLLSIPTFVKLLPYEKYKRQYPSIARTYIKPHLLRESLYSSYEKYKSGNQDAFEVIVNSQGTEYCIQVLKEHKLKLNQKIKQYGFLNLYALKTFFKTLWNGKSSLAEKLKHDESIITILNNMKVE